MLFSESAGPSVHKLYNQSHYALAGLIPATLVSEDRGLFAKVSDLGLALALPVHSHLALNYGDFSLAEGGMWEDHCLMTLCGKQPK